MRIDIKTDKPIKDKEIRALYLIAYAFEHLISARMVKPTLDFFASHYGFELRKIEK